jgi:hypothetical protein
MQAQQETAAQQEAQAAAGAGLAATLATEPMAHRAVSGLCLDWVQHFRQLMCFK